MKALFAAAILFTSGTAVAQERDARGIPVMSEEATAPEGTNQTVPATPGAQVVVANPSTYFATRPATSAYPPCARGQTDRCTQTYEGRPRRRRR